MRIVILLACLACLGAFAILLVINFLPMTKEQAIQKYGLKGEQVALFLSCHKATSESRMQLPTKLDPVQGCACLVSRVKKENYSVFKNVLRPPAKMSNQKLPEFSELPNKKPDTKRSNPLKGVHAFVDFASNAEYCARLGL